MKNVVTLFRMIRISEFAMAYCTYCRKYCTMGYRTYMTQEKIAIHPYRRIHPWKSEIEFADSLLKNVIYNTDGIVAINKPYGIPISYKFQQAANNANLFRGKSDVVGAVDYSVEDTLSYMAKKLDVPALIPCIGSEKYMTGIYVFGIHNDICKQITKAHARAVHLRKFKKYWIITIRVPHQIKGSHHLGMTLKSSSAAKKPVILTRWSNNAMKRNEVQILNVSYKVLSNSTNNLSSLIELSMSKRKWHALRLFASTVLYSPILGDNYHGSRVQEIMGTWMQVDPFAESSYDMPKINKQLLRLLNLTPSQQEIIPAHVHLRSIDLIAFGKKKKDIILEAPLIHPFDWTCKQLMFKDILCETSYQDTKNKVVCL